MTKPGYTFTMSYSNQNKQAHVTFTLDASGGTKFTFNSESPTNTYVSWLSSVIALECVSVFLMSEIIASLISLCSCVHESSQYLR